MQFNLADILFCIVIFQLFFTGSFLLVHARGRIISHVLLGAFFLSVSLNLTDTLLSFKRVWLFSPYLVGWGICLPLLFGPLLFLYTQSVLYRDFSFSRKKWLHFIPFIVFFLGFEISYLFRSKETLVNMLTDLAARKVPVFFYWSSAIIFLQFFLYVAASLRLIGLHKKVAPDHHSNLHYIKLRWLYSTLVFFSCCMLLAAFNGFLGLTAWSKYYYLFFTGLIGLMFVFINRILANALARPQLFSVLQSGETSEAGPAPQLAASREASPGLPTTPLAPGNSPPATSHGLPTAVSFPQEFEAASSRILCHMKENKPYLDPELNLDQLASQLSLRPKFLSRVLNECLHRNFFDFINTYRIDEAKRLFTKPPDKKITILEVLYQSGFNSKSSFNTLFRRYTGLTPTDFRKNLRNS
jgi:AraC-like DNA-binding protein